MNNIIRYFDLFSKHRTTIPTANAGDGNPQPSLGWQLAIFMALALGIFAKGYLEFLADKSSSPVNSWPRFIAAVIAAIGAFPGAYKKAMDDNSPSLVQLCLVFTVGVGVKTLFDTP